MSQIIEAKDRKIPNKVAPGYCVIIDKNGNGARVIEVYMVCEATRGAEVRPVEGRRRGTVPPGALVDKVKAGELVVAQWAPYPQTREDGLPHVSGALGYPGPPTAYIEFEGVRYHQVHGAKYMQAAQAEAAAPKLEMSTAKKGA